MTTNKELVKERFGSNFQSYNKLALVQQQICDEFAQLCASHIERSPEKALELGIGTGFLTRRMVELYPNARWSLNDISHRAAEFTDNYVQNVDSEYIWGDAEQIAYPVELGLVASASTMQWFDDLAGFVARAAAVTQKSGYIALTSFGPENFNEIAALTNETLNYYTRAELEKIVVDGGYKLLYSNDYTKSLLFDSPIDVLRHIKATGVNSITKTNWTRGRLLDFETRYRNCFSIADGRVTLTYHPIYLIAERV